MSVSHPLAADGSHPTEGGNPRSMQQGPNGTTAAAADASGPRTGSYSTLPEQVVFAPPHLGLESRVEFRQVTSGLIDRITVGTGRLVIDCGRLTSIDSAGLNALILVQRRAEKRRVQVFLRGLNKDLLALLVLTKLDDLFEVSLNR